MNEKVIKMERWLTDRGRSFERQKKFKEAILCWTRLLRVLSVPPATSRWGSDVTRLAAIHYRLGMAHRLLEDHRKSLYHLKFSVRLNSSEPRYFEAFGRAHLTGGHWKLAQTQFERALELAPKNPIYIRHYSWALLLMNRKEEALSYAYKAFRLRPKNSETKQVFARVLCANGFFFQAWFVLRGIRTSPRIADLKLECRYKKDATFEGLVWLMLKKGMACDGDPFTVSHLRKAEDMWAQHCVSTVAKAKDAEILSPNAWAAAVCYLSSLQSGDIVLDFDTLAHRFDCTSNEVWPCLKRLQQNVERPARKKRA